MIEVGAKINTDFAIDIVKKGEEQTVIFDELLDRPTIVSVYMRNNTSGCDKQNKSLAAEADWFDEQGYNLVAISKDTCGSHKNYAEKLGINYVLASDPEYKFAEATDSIVEKNMFGNTYEAPTRSAYLIDTDGTVRAVIEKVNTKDHAGELKDMIKNL
ncbi:peroxiredoxin [Fodinibius sediminis]|uniref:thioredoxin-dependent peroxiredoxin n=1 Tax=Fodinibius sediminis TaxID=1214077 RepID=A0A521EDF5_9BACT|nr:redoxin domain-containing protein [Fodinibius sediminis]SMO81905.1 peroxiredoxin Q/BCP [Fodinibius sediminis]